MCLIFGLPFLPYLRKVVPFDKYSMASEYSILISLAIALFCFFNSLPSDDSSLCFCPSLEKPPVCCFPKSLAVSDLPVTVPI